ncbi:MAG: hypothetical protein KAH34_02995 [Ketobacter sp.]|nr:hypothetical protein [Ketobacter sp.]
MEPINSNSSTTLIQPKTVTEKESRDEVEAQRQNETQRPAAEDRFSSSNPVSELQLQRSQVVESLGQAQQAGLEAVQGDTAFPASDQSNSISSQEQAEAAAVQLQQQLNEQPASALDAQANQASREAALTLFQ